MGSQLLSVSWSKCLSLPYPNLIGSRENFCGVSYNFRAGILVLRVFEFVNLNSDGKGVVYNAC